MEKILELSSFVNSLEFVGKSDIQEMISKIILCEMNDQKIGKFDLYNFCADSKNPNKSLRGVACRNGYKYATDGHILIRVKDDYPKEYEDRIILPDGSLLSKDVRVFNYERVLNVITDDYINFDVDFDKIKEIKKEVKLHKKTYAKHSHCFVSLLEDTTIAFSLFDKAASAMQAFGIKHLMLHKNDRTRFLVAECEDAKLVFSPSLASINDNQQDCVKFFKL